MDPAVFDLIDWVQAKALVEFAEQQAIQLVEGQSSRFSENLAGFVQVSGPWG